MEEYDQGGKRGLRKEEKGGQRQEINRFYSDDRWTKIC